MLELMWLNGVIYAFLGAIHLYWAAGGKKWSQNALPQFEENGNPVFVPGLIACLVVGIGLILFAIFSWLSTIIFAHFSRFILIGNIAIAIIFLARSVGDFKYVGFFKKIRSTEFARMDTELYTPLCLYLGWVHAYYALPFWMGR